MRVIEILNGKYRGIFETQQELESWKSKQISKGMWSESDITYEGELIKEYSVSRQEEYRKLSDLLEEAIVEKELGDSTKWNEYIQLRNQIKSQFPKPE